MAAMPGDPGAIVTLTTLSPLPFSAMGSNAAVAAGLGVGSAVGAAVIGTVAGEVD
jgi:hypothetical protein